MKSVLVATDGSESAAEALAFAIVLCKEMSANLEVLSIEQRLPLGRAGGDPPLLEVEEAGGAEHIARAAVDEAAAAGVAATPHVEHGDPADAIVASSTSLNVDLVVVGTRSLGPVAGAIEGSVSHDLIKKSRIPVTVVPGKEHSHAPA